MTADSISTALSTFTDVITSVMSTISGNTLLLTMFCGSLFYMGCSGVKALKKAAKK